jgi:hypothetical protein
LVYQELRDSHNVWKEGGMLCKITAVSSITR